MNKEIRSIEVKELDFDRKNPRLIEYGIKSNATDEDLLKVLWETMDVMEIVQSIAASGFFPHEALIIAEEAGKNIVIEGNRRLAALRVLLDPAIAENNGWTVPAIDEAIKMQIESVPCIVSSRDNAWRYLGFKHVNGPAKWSSYAKAAYIAKVHHESGIPLAQISEQIGDRHRTVQKLYRGLMVLEQAEQSGVYDRDDRWNTRLAFSHLYTGLDRDGIKNFINVSPLDEEAKKPVPEDKLEELGELCKWLYGSRSEKEPPVIKSQNPDLKHLDKVIASREAISTLRATHDLTVAYELSRPSGTVFEESLLEAKRGLQKAHKHMSTGFNNSTDLLKIAGSVANLADDLYEQMERKMDKQKNRISEDS